MPIPIKDPLNLLFTIDAFPTLGTKPLSTSNIIKFILIAKILRGNSTRNPSPHIMLWILRTLTMEFSTLKLLSHTGPTMKAYFTIGAYFVGNVAVHTRHSAFGLASFSKGFAGACAVHTSFLLGEECKVWDS
jgi:hypothetical protein